MSTDHEAHVKLHMAMHEQIRESLPGQLAAALKQAQQAKADAAYWCRMSFGLIVCNLMIGLPHLVRMFAP